MKLEVIRRKEMIEGQSRDLGNRKTKGNINKTKTSFLRTIKLINLQLNGFTMTFTKHFFQVVLSQMNCGMAILWSTGQLLKNENMTPYG